jgi:hypothetical protein
MQIDGTHKAINNGFRKILNPNDPYAKLISASVETGATRVEVSISYHFFGFDFGQYLA